MQCRIRETIVFCLVSLVVVSATAAEQGLVGHWKLAGNAQDSSGGELHARNHRANLKTGEFDGRSGYLEIPDATALNFGTGDFSIALEVAAKSSVTDVVGDLVSKFDPATRRGFVLTFKSNTSGYNSLSDMRPLFFGIDNATDGVWADCGRPGGKTNCSDALTVFNGELYAGIVDAPDEADWQHVFRYRGGQAWEDCGRVGNGKVPGVYAMVVHNGQLYAATGGSHGGDRVNVGDFARVYRYLGGTSWEDIGQPGEHYRVNSLASFDGKLIASSIHTGGQSGGPYVYEGHQKWKPLGKSPGRIHCMIVHDGKLFGAYPQGEVFVFEDDNWKSMGNPYGSTVECNQVHALCVYQGKLYVGTWPNGRVAVWRDGRWVDTGPLGDSTEVVGLIAYNGSLYAGAIPRAEVFRFDGPQNWTSLRRLFDPATFDPKRDTEDWSRASSLTVYKDRMFVSTATCFRAMLSKPQPDEIRGKVYSFKAGEGVSYDHDLGAGWRQVAAVRAGNSLKLYVDGELVAEQHGARKLDVSNQAPLRIGFGPQSHFQGKIRDVRLYRRALDERELQQLRKHELSSTASLQ